MMRLLLLLVLLLTGAVVNAQHLKKDGTPDRRYRENRTFHSASHVTYHPGRHRSTYVYGVARDSHGRIKRSEAARREFMRMTGYPHGRKGYVIDHIIPLKRGGCDCPSNMQWQTKEAAKEKDKTEK